RSTAVTQAGHPYTQYVPASAASHPRVHTRTADSFQRYDETDLRVLVDGRDVSFSEGRPFIARGHVMLPLDPLLAELGCPYSYDPRSRQVTLNWNGEETRFNVGDNAAFVNGEQVRLDEPAQRIDGTLYVPSRLLEEATGVRLDWDAGARILRL